MLKRVHLFSFWRIYIFNHIYRELRTDYKQNLGRDCYCFAQ